MTKAARVALSCIGSLCLPGAALAQAADEWRFDAALYAYLPQISGKTTFPQGDAGADVGIDAQKIIENLKFTAMGSLQARKGAWGGFSDLLYVDIGGGKSQTRDFSIGHAGLPASASANAHLDVKATLWSLAGMRRFEYEGGGAVDVLAGARMLDVKQRVEWELTGNVGPIPLPGRSGSLETKLTHWDGIVGLKGRHPLGGAWSVPWYLDAGAGDSRFTGQVMAGIGYSFPWGELVAAWRYIDYHMKSGDSIESMSLDGPALAAVFHW